MADIKISRKLPLFTKLFSDAGLTRKAYLNALTSVLEYGARLLVAFITIPLVLNGLGNYYYGLWQILNRVMGYISTSSAKPTQALKWSLANQQAFDDYESKRKIVGSTVVVWLIFLPFLGILGGIISWFLPAWLKVPEISYWLVRVTAGIMVLNLILTNLAALPRSVLLGENLGYKRMGLSALLVIIGGGFIWIALLLRTGMVGLATATLITTTIGGILYLSVVRKYSPWFGIEKPSSGGIKKFLGLSGWFLAWDLLFNFMIASDVVILGLLVSVETVSSYTLTKYAPEMLTSVVALIVFGILPGMGGIVGSGNLKKASRVRGEIMTLSWVTLTFLGTTILLWNHVFLKLWVGNNQYAGAIPNLLLIIFVVQFTFIQNDANIINLSLRIHWKVMIGALSLILCLAFASILINRFNLGMIGLLLGFILGRGVLSIWYPLLVSRFFEIKISSQLKGTIRPLIVMCVLFVFAAYLSDDLARSFTLSGLRGWLTLGLSVFFTAVLFLSIVYYIGLASQQRRVILSRVSTILSRTE